MHRAERPEITHRHSKKVACSGLEAAEVADDVRNGSAVPWSPHRIGPHARRAQSTIGDHPSCDLSRCELWLRRLVYLPGSEGTVRAIGCLRPRLTPARFIACP